MGPYEKQAAEKKTAYEKAVEEFKAAGGQPGKRRQEKAALKKEREDKKAKKEARKASGKPARPANAYWLWLNDNREAIQKEVGAKSVSAVGKRAGEIWKELPESKKTPYEKTAAEKKSEYEKLLAEWKAQQGNKENEGGEEDEEEDDEDEE